MMRPTLALLPPHLKAVTTANADSLPALHQPLSLPSQPAARPLLPQPPTCARMMRPTLALCCCSASQLFVPCVCSMLALPSTATTRPLPAASLAYKKQPAASSRQPAKALPARMMRSMLALCFVVLVRLFCFCSLRVWR